MAMSLTCGNFAGKSRSYALVVLLTLATVQRAETAGVPRQGLQRHDERQGRRQAHRSKRFAPTVVMFESRGVGEPHAGSAIQRKQGSSSSLLVAARDLGSRPPIAAEMGRDRLTSVGCEPIPRTASGGQSLGRWALNWRPTAPYCPFSGGSLPQGQV